MAETWEGTGHGKLILCGEHAVVYGFPALAVAVDRSTKARIGSCAGPTRVNSKFGDARLEEAIREILPGEGWEVELTTDLPVGRGMGSSASLAAAVVRADAARRNTGESLRELYERAFKIERHFHGNPSGIDHAVALHGGLIRFRRAAALEMKHLTPPDWPIVVLDSGQSSNTARMVGAVAARRPGCDPVLEKIGALVERAENVLHDVDAFGALLTENHFLLRDLGVSTDMLDTLVELALRCGATGAKLAGAGGGGVALAIGGDPEKIITGARRYGLRAFACRVAGAPA
jgi:mevalonate kinase